MKAFPFRVKFVVSSVIMLIAIALISTVAIFAQVQSSAADLTGTVTDPNGAVIPGAIVTARDSHTNISKSVVSNDSGEYKIIGLPPGSYDIVAEAKTFTKASIKGIVLTVGQSLNLTIKLTLGNQETVVDVPIDSVELIESTKSSVANTIDAQKIETLPINERSATGFALTLSTVGRDNGRPIGPAPTSGLNIGGQRGRSTQVNVDGADFTDNSINASRSTVSQKPFKNIKLRQIHIQQNSDAPRAVLSMWSPNAAQMIFTAMFLVILEIRAFRHAMPSRRSRSRIITANNMVLRLADPLLKTGHFSS